MKRYASRFKQRKLDLIRSDTDEGAGIWSVVYQKYVKPKGFIGGVTKEKAAPDRYSTEPVSPGIVDGY